MGPYVPGGTNNALTHMDNLQGWTGIHGLPVFTREKQTSHNPVLLRNQKQISTYLKDYLYIIEKLDIRPSCPASQSRKGSKSRVSGVSVVAVRREGILFKVRILSISESPSATNLRLRLS